MIPDTNIDIDASLVITLQLETEYFVTTPGIPWKK